jgi:two-component system, LytTR family, sensor kinase
MRPRAARAFLVVAAFTLLATAVATQYYLYDAARAGAPAPKTPPPAKSLSLVFWSSFRYYLAWGLSVPAVFWLVRKVPIVQRRWWRAAAFHLAIPVVAAFPFLLVRLGVTVALTGQRLSIPKLFAAWRQVLPIEAATIYPVYWILVAVAVAHQLHREAAGREEQAVRLQRSLADAQLDALRMKLQPHFLFNALNAVGSLAEQGETEAVVEMVEHLGTLLRLSMDTSARQFVTLEEELRLLDAYLSVEEVRYRDRLVVVRTIDRAVAGTLVPSLILQPLAQNAIAHGLGGRMDATTVEIAARRSGDWLEVLVRDDGPGVPPGWSLPSGAGRGLANVLERLEALYGASASLDVARRAEGGTACTLRLPLVEAPSATEERYAWTA